MKIFFIILLKSISAGEILRFKIFDAASVTINNLFLVCLIIFWIFFSLISKKNIRKGKLTKPILIFAGIAFLSLVINSRFLTQQEFIVSFLYLVRWIFYASLYFIVLQFDEKFKKRIPYIMLVPGALIVIVGYIQYFLYPSLRNLYYLGWDAHLYRMFSSFLDPNFARAFFVLYFILAAVLFFEFLKRKNMLNSISLGVLGIGTFIAIFLTYSRSAILMLIISILILLIVKKKVAYGVILILFIIATIVLAPKAFKTEGTDLFRKVSSGARISSAQQALKIFADNSILGVGFNTYRYAKYRYGLTGTKSDPSHAEGGTDVSLLFVLATTGILGFISYVFLWGKIISSVIKQTIQGNIISQVLLISFIALLLNSFFINSLFYSFFMMWMWILVGLTENK